MAEDIVTLLRGKYEDVAAVVPGAAKSAGTLIVMASDEILMEPASALGPIDAQIVWQGKQFSAEALLEGLKAIQDEVETAGTLNSPSSQFSTRSRPARSKMRRTHSTSPASS